MAVLTGLEPAGVWKYFEELSNIPRGSYHEKAASDYCVAFAKAHGLEVWQDRKDMRMRNPLFYRDIWIWYARRNQAAPLILGRTV